MKLKGKKFSQNNVNFKSIKQTVIKYNFVINCILLTFFLYNHTETRNFKVF